MKLLVFWFSFAIVGYTYVGYFVFLSVLARLRREPVLKQAIVPPVSIVIAARNEEARLPAKLADLLLQNYPKDRLQIVVVSDGSVDGTAALLRTHSLDLVPIILEEPQGKAAALNHAVRVATGDVLLFLDVRQSLEASAITRLVACFADPGVGAVSGELLLESGSGISSSNALGMYWKIEKALRRLESASGSVVGATGAIYAIRRELYTEMPAGTILDDVFVPMHVVRQGKRVVFEPTAIARDHIFSEKGKEFSRKVRTLTGNYQLVQLAPWLVTRANPVLFRFISHKLLRLLAPFLLILMLAISATVHGSMFRAIFLLELAFYSMAAAGTLRPSSRRFKPVAMATTFVVLNIAAAVSFYNFVTRQDKVWVR
jgi:cellulose synthase/poly-beta-1,6-N-acetylglucosamine synthase-like glycosyltransferase